MQMSSEMVAAIQADFNEPGRGWGVASAHEEFHTKLNVVAGSLVETAERHVTLTIRSDVKGKNLIFMLSGPAVGALTSATLLIAGSSYRTTDAGLIAWLQNAVDAIGPVAEAAAMAAYFGPGEESV